MVTGLPRMPSFLVLGDLDVALPGQVDDGGHDLLDVHLLVDERPGQPGREVGRRLGDVAGVDRRGLVPATAAPEQQHGEKHEDGKHEAHLGHDEGTYAPGGPRELATTFLGKPATIQKLV